MLNTTVNIREEDDENEFMQNVRMYVDKNMISLVWCRQLETLERDSNSLVPMHSTDLSTAYIIPGYEILFIKHELLTWRPKNFEVMSDK